MESIHILYHPPLTLQFSAIASYIFYIIPSSVIHSTYQCYLGILSSMQLMTSSPNTYFSYLNCLSCPLFLFTYITKYVLFNLLNCLPLHFRNLDGTNSLSCWLYPLSLLDRGCYGTSNSSSLHCFALSFCFLIAIIIEYCYQIKMYDLRFVIFLPFRLITVDAPLFQTQELYFYLHEILAFCSC